MSNGNLKTPWVVPQEYGALGDGSNNDASAFQQADATGKPILVPPATYLIASALVLNSAIRFEPGATLKLIFGATVTFNGPLEAGPWQIFETSQNPGAGGGITFGQSAVNRAFPEWWGAKGDGVAQDSDALEATIGATAEGGTIAFPANATYRLTRTVQGRTGLRWVFNSTTFLADTAGQYDAVLDKVGVDTGYKVFFAVDHGMDSIYSGRLFLKGAGAHIPNLCGISGNTSSNSGMQRWEWLRITDFERGIFAANQSHGNTIVGHHFGTVELFSNGYDLYFTENGSDDAVFDVIRSQSSPFDRDAGKANLYLDTTYGLVIHSIYVSGQRADRNGIHMNKRATLVCDHMYLEHGFDKPILIDGEYCSLRIGNLKVSEAFNSTNGQVIEFADDAVTCMVDVTFNARVLDAPNVKYLVRLNSTAGTVYGRVVRVKLSFATTGKTPVLYDGGGTITADLIEVYAEDGVYRYFYDGATTTAERQDTFLAVQTAATTLGSVSARIEVFDSAGNALGFVPVYDSIT